MTTPLVFTKTDGNRTTTVTLALVDRYDMELEVVVSVDGREVDRENIDYRSSAERVSALAAVVASYESNGYTRVA